jgi:hypothetical protein
MTTMADDLQSEASKTSIHSDDIKVSRIRQKLNALPKDSVKKVSNKENAIDLKVIRPLIEYNSPVSDGLALDERGISGAAREINSAATCHRRSRAPLPPILDHQAALILVVICKVKSKIQSSNMYMSRT